MSINKKLYRSRTKRMLSGVCGGLEDYFDIDVTLIRFIWILIAIFSAFFPVVIAYVIAVFVIPEEPVNYYNNDANRASEADYRMNKEDENKQ